MGSENISTALHPTTDKFQHLLQSATTRALNFVTEEDFISYYKQMFKKYEPYDKSVRPPLAGSSAEAKKLRSMFHDFVIEGIHLQINDYVKEQKLDNKFRQLENLKLCSGISQTKTPWRPPGDADLHIQAFDVSAKLEKKKQLQMLVKDKENQLGALQDRLAAQKVKLSELENKIKTTYEKTGDNFSALVEKLQLI